LLTLAVALLFVSTSFMSEGNGTTVIPITQSWLNQQLVAWKPAQNASIGFGGVLQRASYGSLESPINTAQVQSADLGMLTAAGASCLRIDLNYAPWLLNQQNYISKMDSVVNQIKAGGHCLVIADAGSESYRSGGAIPWSQFKAAWVQRVQTIAQRYRPYGYVVIKEVATYGPMVSDSLTNPLFQNVSDWLSLTQSLVNAVASVSPSTKVGVSVATDCLSCQFYTQYLAGVEKIVGISMIGLDLYTASGFQNVLSFLSSYGSGGKKLWIAEAWSTNIVSTASSPSRATMDKEWMLVLYYFALKIHATMVIPFYTDIFASYGSWPSQSSSIISTYQAQRTPVFVEYHSLTSTYGATVQ